MDLLRNWFPVLQLVVPPLAGEAGLSILLCLLMLLWLPPLIAADLGEPSGLQADFSQMAFPGPLFFVSVERDPILDLAQLLFEASVG